MQPYFFPYLGYFQLIAAVDLFVIYDDVNFIRGGWINRNHILSQGVPLRLTLSLDGASSFVRINQTKLAGKHSKLLKSIEQSYSRAAQFPRIFPLMTEIFGQETDALCTFVTHGLRETARVLNIKTPMMLCSELQVEEGLRGQDRVLAVCRATGATHYINAIGGQGLYSAQAFRNEGMSLSFLESHFLPYPQQVPEFVPGLSIIDVLMHADESMYPRLLSAYDLV